MISIINETFEQNIANNVIKYLEHPTATIIKEYYWWGNDEDEDINRRGLQALSGLFQCRINRQ